MHAEEKQRVAEQSLTDLDKEQNEGVEAQQAADEADTALAGATAAVEKQAELVRLGLSPVGASEHESSRICSEVCDRAAQRRCEVTTGANPRCGSAGGGCCWSGSRACCRPTSAASRTPTAGSSSTARCAELLCITELTFYCIPFSMLH